MLKNKEKPRGASFNRQGAESVNQGKGLVSFLKSNGLGFMLGVLVTLLCQTFLIGHSGTASKSDFSAQGDSQSASLGNSRPITGVISAEAKQPVFDFYTKLPHAKAGDASNGLIDKASSHKASSGKSTVTSGTSSAPVVNKTVSAKVVQKPVSITAVSKQQVTSDYLVQAASLKDEPSAEALQKKMQLWGLSAQVKQVSGKGGAQWYRVQSGPFTTLQSAKDALGVLVLHGMKGLLVRK